MTAPRGKPAEEVTRFHQLELQVQRMAKTLAGVNNDPELVAGLLHVQDYRFSSYNLSIVLGCLVHHARVLYEQLEAAHVEETGEPVKVVNELPHGHPERVKPLREVWPLCRHEDPTDPYYVDADVREDRRLPLVTKTGKVLTEEEIDRLAAEAARGYDVSGLLGRPNRREVQP